MTQLATRPYLVAMCSNCGCPVMSDAIGHVETTWSEEGGTEPVGFICPACDHNYYLDMRMDRDDSDPFADE